MSRTSRQTTASRFAVRLLAGAHEVSVAPLLLALFARSPAYGRVRALDAAIETPLSIGHLMLVSSVASASSKRRFCLPLTHLRSLRRLTLDFPPDPSPDVANGLDQQAEA